MLRYERVVHAILRGEILPWHGAFVGFFCYIFNETDVGTNFFILFNGDKNGYSQLRILMYHV